MSKPIYLKQYEGVTTGSHMGRDDGYPETKYIPYSTIDLLSKDFGKQKDEHYYKLVPISKEELSAEVAKSLETQKETAKQEKKETIEKRIQALQKQLEALER